MQNGYSHYEKLSASTAENYSQDCHVTHQYLAGMYPRKLKGESQRSIYMLAFIEELLVTAKIYKQLNCPWACG